MPYRFRERGSHVTSSSLHRLRKTIVPLAGALLFGITGTAAADHDRGTRIVVSTPGFYFSTDSRLGGYGYDQRRDRPHRGHYPPRRPVYVPGYWAWVPAPGYGRDHGWQERPARHHGWKQGWNRHDKRDHHRARDGRRWRDRDD